MARWKLIVRHGSDVSRQGFDDLDSAIGAAETTTDTILADEPLGKVKAFRDYDPDQRVKARIEITGKGVLRPPTAGLDIQGDGGMLGFTGGLIRKPIEADDRKQIFAGIRRFLQG